MTARAPSCPRCRGELYATGASPGAWACARHGQVPPLQPARPPSPEGLDAVRDDARVPVWLPWPLPEGWLVSGFAGVGSERTGALACAVALSGPAPLGGPADMVLVAEEPGVGLGAYHAGLAGPDPGPGFDTGTPHARMHVLGHPLPLWNVDGGPDHAVFAGEALACWLWVVLWPAEAGVLLLEDLVLADLRDAGEEPDIPYGSPSPRLFP